MASAITLKETSIIRSISNSSRSQENHRQRETQARFQASKCKVFKAHNECSRFGLLLILFIILARDLWPTNWDVSSSMGRSSLSLKHSFILAASGHIVLTRDDRGQSLVLTGEDGKGGKGGKGGGGDQLVIAGSNMGGQNSNMVLQDASNREGDVVISGNSMVVPGEDGHIVLADNRAKEDGGGNNQARGPPPNLFAFWMPYMYGRFGFRTPMQFFGGGQFGGGPFG